MHANRLMPNVYRKKLLAFTIIERRNLLTRAVFHQMRPKPT